MENGPKKPGKKKKKRRINILSQKGEENGSVGDGEEDKESVTSETKTVDSNDNGNGEKPVKRKYVHHVPLPSDIKTRGAKLPKYSFERKTHKKIPIQEKQMPKPHVCILLLHLKVTGYSIISVYPHTLQAHLQKCLKDFNEI